MIDRRWLLLRPVMPACSLSRSPGIARGPSSAMAMRMLAPISSGDGGSPARVVRRLVLQALGAEQHRIEQDLVLAHDHAHRHRHEAVRLFGIADDAQQLHRLGIAQRSDLSLVVAADEEAVVDVERRRECQAHAGVARHHGERQPGLRLSEAHRGNAAQIVIQLVEQLAKLLAADLARDEQPRLQRVRIGTEEVELDLAVTDAVPATR